MSTNTDFWTKIYWYGEVPTHCQIRPDRPITNEFVDGKIVGGGWCLMHPSTHAIFGVGFGLGKGQLYSKQANGRWLKVKG